MADRIYLDTSVYLGILLGDKDAVHFIRLIKNSVYLSSVLLLVETERNLVRLSREGDLDLGDYDRCMDQVRQDCELFILREVTPDLCLTGVYPPSRIPRSSDLIHIRTALWFKENEGLDFFCTLDQNQMQSARDLGLPILSIT